jgi:hypothetical protein
MGFSSVDWQATLNIYISNIESIANRSNYLARNHQGMPGSFEEEVPAEGRNRQRAQNR